MLALRDLPIGKKLAALLLLFIVGLALFIGFIFQTAHVVRSNTQYAGRAWPLLLQVGDCSRLTAEMRDAYAVAITSQDADMLQSAREQGRLVESAITKLVQGAAANGISIGALAPTFDAYRQAADAWARAIVDGHGAAGTAQTRLYDLSQRQEQFRQQLDKSHLAINAALEARLHNVEREADRTWQVGLFGGLALSVMVLVLNGAATRRLIVQPLQRALMATARIAEGHWDEAVVSHGNDELGLMLHGIESLRVQLRERREADLRREQVAALVAGLHLQMRGDLDVAALCDQVIRYLAPRLGCEIGLVYVHQNGMLQPVAAYALTLAGVAPIPLGHSLVGQVAHSGRANILHDLPIDYMKTIETGSVGLPPRNVAILPVHHEDELLAVVELGAIDRFDSDFLANIGHCSEHFAVALKVARARLPSASNRQHGAQPELAT